ncbi:hypothetical protein GCM10009593_26480 [Microlunatus antarcticus]
MQRPGTLQQILGGQSSLGTTVLAPLAAGFVGSAAWSSVTGRDEMGGRPGPLARLFGFGSRGRPGGYLGQGGGMFGDQGGGGTFFAGIGSQGGFFGGPVGGGRGGGSRGGPGGGGGLLGRLLDASASRQGSPDR